MCVRRITSHTSHTPPQVKEKAWAEFINYDSQKSLHVVGIDLVLIGEIVFVSTSFLQPLL